MTYDFPFQNKLDKSSLISPLYILGNDLFNNGYVTLWSSFKIKKNSSAVTKQHVPHKSEIL